ncbi:MAG: YicC family protein [Oscillospiraceae bacterium]|nr:YicC family protein [Oscillospiraceae bacterium]
MVKSMTGYGRASETLHMRGITVEVKSVNHRYLDCTVKTARAYAFLDETVKTTLSGFIARGKTDVFITIDNTESEKVNIKLNEPLLRGYLEVYERLNDEFALSGTMSASEAIRIPEVLTVEKEEADAEELTADVVEVLIKALEAQAEMRTKEGMRLSEDILSRLAYIEKLAATVEERSPKCVEEYREKLEARMKEVLESVSVDPQRILTEAAIFADKIAVDEETVRLHSHIAQFREMLRTGGPIGRKLDFLVQELNREVNTIGSKANDLEITSTVVDIKAEIEKIREQVQNIE